MGSFQLPKQKIDSENVEETFDAGHKLIAVDYYDSIKDIKALQPYIQNIKEMNLYNRGWRFQFGTSKEWAGLCNASLDQVALSKTKNIFISIDFVKHDENWKKQMDGVILHEIAHAIVFEIFSPSNSFSQRDLKAVDSEHFATQGHGKVWGLVCSAIRGSAGGCSRYYEGANYKESFKNYRYECFNCGHKAYGNFMNFAVKCVKCDKPVIVENTL